MPIELHDDLIFGVKLSQVLDELTYIQMPRAMDGQGYVSEMGSLDWNCSVGTR